MKRDSKFFRMAAKAMIYEAGQKGEVSDEALDAIIEMGLMARELEEWEARDAAAAAATPESKPESKPEPKREPKRPAAPSKPVQGATPIGGLLGAQHQRRLESDADQAISRLMG